MIKDLEVALTAALKAGEIQVEGRKGALDIERKGDSSPVTQVDKACEACVREVIGAAFPDDGFLGEETGESASSNKRRWIVDPIDGTRPFIRGIPTHSVLIALEEDGVPTIGVIHLPGMGLTCYASKGNGAFLFNSECGMRTVFIEAQANSELKVKTSDFSESSEKISVSQINKLSAAMGSTLGIVEYADEPLGRGLINFMRSLDYVYGFMDAYSYVLLACGKIDVCVNLLDKPWDCAAAACIVTEAGGQYSSISGEQTVHAGSFVMSNGILHDDVLKFFAG